MAVRDLDTVRISSDGLVMVLNSSCEWINVSMFLHLECTVDVGRSITCHRMMDKQ